MDPHIQLIQGKPPISMVGSLVKIHLGWHQRILKLLVIISTLQMTHTGSATFRTLIAKLPPVTRTGTIAIGVLTLAISLMNLSGMMSLGRVMSTARKVMMLLPLRIPRRGSLYAKAKTIGRQHTGIASGRTIIVTQLLAMQIGTPATGIINATRKNPVSAVLMTTLIVSIQTLLKTAITPTILVERTTTAGGTTSAALKTSEKTDFTTVTGMTAAKPRLVYAMWMGTVQNQVSQHGLSATSAMSPVITAAQMAMYTMNATRTIKDAMTLHGMTVIGTSNVLHRY